MPQLNQLPDIFWSQLFWLTVVFGIIFFGIGLGMLPKIQSTVDIRGKKIADDLERAQSARSAAEETEAAWRPRRVHGRHLHDRLPRLRNHDALAACRALDEPGQVGLRFVDVDDRFGHGLSLHDQVR